MDVQMIDRCLRDAKELVTSVMEEMKRKYDRADRDEAEEAYGDYVDVVEAVTEALADMRDRFARTLDDDTAVEYEAAFNRAVRRRWPPFGLEIENR